MSRTKVPVLVFNHTEVAIGKGFGSPFWRDTCASLELIANGHTYQGNVYVAVGVDRLLELLLSLTCHPYTEQSQYNLFARGAQGAVLLTRMSVEHGAEPTHHGTLSLPQPQYLTQSPQELM